MFRNAIPTVLLSALLALGLVSTARCGKKGSAKKENRVVPPKPENGSPIAATFVKFERSGKDTKVKVTLYNFGNKTAGGYFFLARYYDKSGKLLKRKKGTSFEKDFDFMSMSGGLRNQCKPQKHCDITIEMMSVPKDAVTAKVLVSSVQAVDGMKLVNWWQQKHRMSWPKAAAMGK